MLETRLSSKCLQQHLLEQIQQPNGAKKVERFLREICFYREHTDLPGILPLIDSHLPQEPSLQDPPWLVTRLAIPAHKAFATRKHDFVAIVSYVVQVAHTLSLIHRKSIYHRDIKPENLFLLDGHPLVGDFGLIELPEVEPITDEGELVGPLHYAAPEMISDGARSNGGPADVYSLAKTLWVLGTGQRYPLPGHQRIDVSGLTLSAFVTHDRAVLLDPLIERATSVNPSVRPTMSEVARNLQEWLREPTTAINTFGLSHLKARLEAALEPGRRTYEIREECDNLAMDIFEVFLGHLRRTREMIAEVVEVSRIRMDYKQ